MHFAVVTKSIPNLESDGDHQTPWMITQAMLDAGHRVTSCLILDPADQGEQERGDKWLKDFKQMGTDIVTVQLRPSTRQWADHPAQAIKRIFAPSIEYMFPEVTVTSQVNEALKRAQPDGVFALYWGPVAATHGLDLAPRMAMLGSLPHALESVRWEMTGLSFKPSDVKRRVLKFMDDRSLKRLEVRLLSECQSIADFARGQVDELHKLGVTSCKHLTNPAYDFGGPDWHQRRNFHGPRSKAKILLLGQMGATFTRFGLQLFANETLPILEQKLGPENAEIHLVGSGTLSDTLAKQLESPMVKFRGWVESADEEFLSADVMVVPNQVQMGQRTKIMHALSCGCCIVAHQANTAESPDLIDGENILISKNGAELAETIIRAIADPDLRNRIGANARQTYEENYSAKATGPALVAEMEKMVGAVTA